MERQKNMTISNQKTRFIFSFPKQIWDIPRANNTAASNHSADFYFVLNADISFSDPRIFEMIIHRFQKDPSIAILGTRQQCPNGNTESTVRRFPSLFAQVSRRTPLRKMPFLSRLVRQYEYDDFDYSKTQEVDWLQSSFWAVRGDFWKQVKGFDEDYFVFLADTQMCRTAWEKQKKVLYFADVCVQADGIRASEGGIKDFFTKKEIRIHTKDALRYFWEKPVPKESKDVNSSCRNRT
jgi:N-acetylglucosaminyl-diphospho-decaprenol L-rhamnosyltransferase